MSGVEDLDPQNDGVEESHRSHENEVVTPSETSDHDASGARTARIAETAQPDSDDTVDAESMHTGSVHAGSDSDEQASDEVVTGEPVSEETVAESVSDYDTQISETSTPVTRTAVSPSPIPILDRPPANPYVAEATGDINAIYDGADAPDSAETSTDTGSLETSEVPAAVNADETVVPETPVTEAVTTGAVTTGTAATETPDATTGGASYDDTATSVGIPVVDSPPARTSYKDVQQEDAKLVSDVSKSQSDPLEPNDATMALNPVLSNGQNNAHTLGSGSSSTPATAVNETVVLPVPHRDQTSESQVTPLDGFEEEKSGRTGMKAFVGIAATVLVVGGAYAGAQYLFADKIAKDVTVAGVHIGGLSEPEASKKLDAELASKLSDKIALVSGDTETSIVPKDAGIALDSDATVEGLTGFSWSPVTLWEHLTGGEPVEPVLSVEDELFTAAATDVSSAFYVEPVNGTVAFVDSRAVATPAVEGTSVEPERVEQVVTQNLFTEQRPIEVTATAVAPEVTQEATDAALATAKTIASAAVTVKVEGQTAELPQEAFTQDVAIKFVEGVAQFEFDGAKLAKDVIKRTTDLLKESEDARFVFVDGKPTIEPGEAGTTIDESQLAVDFSTAASSTSNRTVDAVVVETDPEQSVEKLEKLGIKELVATFSTPITNEYLRTENLKVAAKRITGYLVEPGEQFDLLKVIGPVTAENGYHSAGVIVNGVHTDGVGGGLSQVATTTYNTGFFAGMTDIAHRPHSVWFKRYPAGRESTMFVGSIDMIWQNDSETGILMRSYVANGKLTVEAWGTETYKVETTTSPRSNVRPATMTTSTDPKCAYYPVGEAGFTVTVTRKVTELVSGTLVKDEAKTWTYRPDNGVTCKKEEPKKDTSKSKDKSKDD